MQDEYITSKNSNCMSSTFVDLVACWEKSLFITAWRILGNSEDAEEARQNVLLRILESPDRLPASSFEPWIRRCIINEALSLLRRREREKGAYGKHADRIYGMAVPAAQPLEKEELSRVLQESLQELEPDTRVMLSLRFDDGLTIREIAEVVRKPHTTIQSALQSAYRVLRTKLALFEDE